MWKGYPFGWETVLAMMANSMIYRLDKWYTGKKTVEPCQDKAGKIFEISVSQKSLPAIVQGT